MAAGLTQLASAITITFAVKDGGQTRRINAVRETVISESLIQSVKSCLCGPWAKYIEYWTDAQEKYAMIGSRPQRPKLPVTALINFSNGICNSKVLNMNLAFMKQQII